MRKVPKISLFFCLTGVITVLSGSAFGSDFQKVFSYADTEFSLISDGDDLLYSTPFPVLFLSEILIDSGSEIEPKESKSTSFLPPANLSFDNHGYLKKSKRILISLTIRDLIFPFHTHL